MVMKTLQQLNNKQTTRPDELDDLNNAQKQQFNHGLRNHLDIAAVNRHEQTAESLNIADG